MPANVIGNNHCETNIILIGQAALKYIRKNNRLLGIAFDFLGIQCDFQRLKIRTVTIIDKTTIIDSGFNF
jgi:hypothetical protein